MLMDNIKKIFTKTDENGFPRDNCTRQNHLENNVFDGTDMYLCLIIDARFPGYYEIMPLQPYICIDNKNNELFGWSDKDGNVVDNLYKSIHIDDRCVIGCIKDDTDNDEREEEWKGYRGILESQWED